MIVFLDAGTTIAVRLWFRLEAISYLILLYNSMSIPDDDDEMDPRLELESTVDFIDLENEVRNDSRHDEDARFDPWGYIGFVELLALLSLLDEESDKLELLTRREVQMHELPIL